MKKHEKHEKHEKHTKNNNNPTGNNVIQKQSNVNENSNENCSEANANQEQANNRSQDKNQNQDQNRNQNQNQNNQAQNQQAQAQSDQAGAQLQEQALQAITQLGTPQVTINDSNIVCISIIGQIEGHMILPPQNKTTKYEHIIPQLVAAEQNVKIEGVLVILNTVGGDVEAGLAIAELISTMTKPSVTLVLGGGHSIGAPIAVSGNVSYIADSATMTIHPIRMNGLVIGVPQSFEYLDKMQDRVTRFITKHSNISEEQFKTLMYKTGELTRDIGTTIIGEDAVKYGLIDRVGGIGDALSTLREIIEEKKDHERSS